MKETEEKTGISHQQVSRWAKRLKDEEKYKAQICGAAWKATMLDDGDKPRQGGAGKN